MRSDASWALYREYQSEVERCRMAAAVRTGVVFVWGLNALFMLLDIWWAEPEHYLDLGEILVRNVTTDIRGGFDTRRINDGNSIFVFEVAGLCIGHLGHLHHEPTDAQYAALGRLDVVMAAVDGGLTRVHTWIDRSERLARSGPVRNRPCAARRR